MNKKFKYFSKEDIEYINADGGSGERFFTQEGLNKLVDKCNSIANAPTEDDYFKLASFYNDIEEFDYYTKALEKVALWGNIDAIKKLKNIFLEEYARCFGSESKKIKNKYRDYWSDLAKNDAEESYLLALDYWKCNGCVYCERNKLSCYQDAVRWARNAYEKSCISLDKELQPLHLKAYESFLTNYLRIVTKLNHS